MSRFLIRLMLALALTLFAFVSYCSKTSVNPVTGESQHVQLTPQEEIMLGQQGAESVINQFGGLYPDGTLQRYVAQIGQQVVQSSPARDSPYIFDFHVLADPETVNAFALPGGQIFITTALLRRLTEESQLAGVLGHEVGHVVARHGAEQLARQQLGGLLTQAINIAASDEQSNGRQAAMITQVVNQLVGLRYGREDELESDRLGFEFMVDAQYDPTGIVELMEILNTAQGGEQPPEFLSSHPNPGNRIERLETLIAASFPHGIPPELKEGEQAFAQIVRPRLR